MDERVVSEDRFPRWASTIMSPIMWVIWLANYHRHWDTVGLILTLLMTAYAIGFWICAVSASTSQK